MIAAPPPRGYFPYDVSGGLLPLRTLARLARLAATLSMVIPALAQNATGAVSGSPAAAPSNRLLTQPAAASSVPAWMLGPFVRIGGGRPALTPDPRLTFFDPMRQAPVHWEALHTFNPAAVVHDGRVDLLYRAEDDTGNMAIGGHTSRIGLAESADGVQFTPRATPVLFPSADAQSAREWPGGVEDPRIVERPDGLYVLTYTQWNRKTYRAAIATSRDLIHWTKYGPAFGDAPGNPWSDLRYKSAAIVTRLANGRLVAARIHGRYWMYWGEGSIRLATSPDLIHWTPVMNRRGEMVTVLTARPGHFDSSFPEAGPPPVLTAQGIVVIYNGRNSADGGDPALAAGAYSDGQALFSARNPAKLLARSEKPFFKPELPFEKSGQYAAGTTFAEGLVFFRGRWLLYYGCADSFVGVAAARSR